MRNVLVARTGPLFPHWLFNEATVHLIRTLRDNADKGPLTIYDLSHRPPYAPIAKDRFVQPLRFLKSIWFAKERPLTAEQRKHMAHRPPSQWVMHLEIMNKNERFATLVDLIDGLLPDSNKLFYLDLLVHTAKSPKPMRLVDVLRAAKRSTRAMSEYKQTLEAGAHLLLRGTKGVNQITVTPTSVGLEVVYALQELTEDIESRLQQLEETRKRPLDKVYGAQPTMCQ